MFAYRRWGRVNSPKVERDRDRQRSYGEPVAVAIAVSHCGAGRTLGDIAGAWLVFLVSRELLGLALPAEYVADFTLAFVLGIAFQYFSIVPMRGLG